jgi:hypothetical protein
MRILNWEGKLQLRISAVMNFKPNIREYHQNKIADLRLREYSAYKSLIDVYPQLKIADDVKISQYSCPVM